MTTITRLDPSILGDRRYPEVGRIRLGDKSEKGAPRKLTKFRLTSPHLDLLQRVADVYGGTCQAWADAPTGKGTQHELYIESRVIEVMIPNGLVLTQSFELWKAGGCERRCDGIVTTEGKPCVCPVDPEERHAAAQQGKACKLTTRLSMWLPKIPGLGVWRMESHGYYAALELPGAADILSMATQAGQPIPATLRIASRVTKKDGKTSQYIVPQLDLDITVDDAYALARGQEPGVIDATAQTAIGASPTPELPPPAPREVVLVERVARLDAERIAFAKTAAKNAGATAWGPKALANAPAAMAAVEAWLDNGAELPVAPADPPEPPESPAATHVEEVAVVTPGTCRTEGCTVAAQSADMPYCAEHEPF